MAEYTKPQSTIIALWVLARHDNTQAVPGATAPAIITELVNRLGDHHSSDSVLLHKHGYDRLLFGRRIDKVITNIQRDVAKDLLAEGIITQIHDV